MLDNFHFLKASCDYAFHTSNVFNTTGNYLIKEWLHLSFLFLEGKSLQRNLINNLTSLIWINWKGIFDMKCESLRITKMLQEQLRKFLGFCAKVSLLTTEFDTGFCGFRLKDASLRDEPRLERPSDFDKDVLREMLEYWCGPKVGTTEGKHGTRVRGKKVTKVTKDSVRVSGAYYPVVSNIGSRTTSTPVLLPWACYLT